MPGDGRVAEVLCAEPDGASAQPEEAAPGALGIDGVSMFPEVCGRKSNEAGMGIFQAPVCKKRYRFGGRESICTSEMQDASKWKVLLKCIHTSPSSIPSEI